MPKNARPRRPGRRPLNRAISWARIERATINLFERVSPSVVQIVVITNSDPSAPNIKSGSGFFWDTGGNIVTNAHVVQDAKVIAVWLALGGQLEAEVVGSAPNSDLAVIRPKDLRNMPPPIAIGSSSNLKVGQLAFVIGSPFGLDQSLTAGVISALKRKLPRLGLARDLRLKWMVRRLPICQNRARTWN